MRLSHSYRIGQSEGWTNKQYDLPYYQTRESSSIYYNDVNDASWIGWKYSLPTEVQDSCHLDCDDDGYYKCDDCIKGDTFYDRASYAIWSQRDTMGNIWVNLAVVFGILSLLCLGVAVI